MTELLIATAPLVASIASLLVMALVLDQLLGLKREIKRLVNVRDEALNARLAIELLHTVEDPPHQRESAQPIDLLAARMTASAATPPPSRQGSALRAARASRP